MNGKYLGVLPAPPPLVRPRSVCMWGRLGRRPRAPWVGAARRGAARGIGPKGLPMTMPKLSLALLMLATRHAVALGWPIQQCLARRTAALDPSRSLYPSRELLTTSSSSSAAILACCRAPACPPAWPLWQCACGTCLTRLQCACASSSSHASTRLVHPASSSAMALCRTKAGRGTGGGKCVIEASPPGRFGR